MISSEFLITSLVLVLMPGTGVLYTVSASLFGGKKSSLFASLGCTLGIVPSLIASILGLAVVLNASAQAFQIIKFVGVAYLLYLAWSMLKSSGALTIKENGTSKSLYQVAFKGFLINILNPKLTAFFLAFLPQFIPYNAPNPTSNMLVLGSIFMLMTFCVFILYGVLATRVRHYIIHSEKMSVILQRTFAGSFALLGLKLALTEQK